MRETLKEKKLTTLKDLWTLVHTEVKDTQIDYQQEVRTQKLTQEQLEEMSERLWVLVNDQLIRNRLWEKRELLKNQVESQVLLRKTEPAPTKGSTSFRPSGKYRWISSTSPYFPPSFGIAVKKFASFPGFLPLMVTVIPLHIRQTLKKGYENARLNEFPNGNVMI